MSIDDLDVTDTLRIFAFIAGIILLFSGFADLGRATEFEVLSALSTGSTGLLKIIFGAFLMIAGVNPDAVKMAIKVFIRR